MRNWPLLNSTTISLCENGNPISSREFRIRFDKEKINEMYPSCNVDKKDLTCKTIFDFYVIIDKFIN